MNADQGNTVSTLTASDTKIVANSTELGFPHFAEYIFNILQKHMATISLLILLLVLPTTNTVVPGVTEKMRLFSCH